MGDSGLQIVNWDETFETASSRKLKRMKWVACPADIQSAGLLTLTQEFGVDGVTAFGIFQMLVQFHGTNTDIDGRRLGIISHGSAKVLPIRLIAAALRVPNDALKRSLEILCSEQVAWLRQISPNDLPHSSHTPPKTGVGVSVHVGVDSVEGECEGETADHSAPESAEEPRVAEGTPGGQLVNRLASRFEKLRPSWRAGLLASETRNDLLSDHARLSQLTEDDLASVEEFYRDSQGEKLCQKLGSLLLQLPEQVERASSWKASKATSGRNGGGSNNNPKADRTAKSKFGI